MNLFLNLYLMEKKLDAVQLPQVWHSLHPRPRQGRHTDYRSPQGCDRLNGPSDWLGEPPRKVGRMRMGTAAFSTGNKV